jgi:hypothetical protein
MLQNLDALRNMVSAKKSYQPNCTENCTNRIFMPKIRMNLQFMHMFRMRAPWRTGHAIIFGGPFSRFGHLLLGELSIKLSVLFANFVPNNRSAHSHFLKVG